ncbi:GNAT family N-acetyltransferase [Limosilactobacillus antri]|uniref:Acetyltransferase, GNAT family n=1 Tax=Limosilactobacillus antri DSM 16041 TaxID=525309 RepID=C8P9W9_9LACO|nr:GNAT family N-acetyltransferase [Limosilactobacillus antri]EEW52691.1 acetyltransferase, GNAT family [Limosilactobacillus antri DSM 16041]KRK59582.1 hypothetical protein FC31_GL000602 [Limosilactobacillus antri DSM 16041]
MQIKQATAADLDVVCRFYQDVCAQQQNDEYGADWHWGVYPSQELLAARIENGMVVEGLVNGQVASVGVLTAGEDPNYRRAEWAELVPDRQIAVLHLFAVNKDFRGRGLAQQMLRELAKFAKDKGYAVMHLDVMKGNVPAERAYLNSGFRFAGELVLHYADIGDTPVHMYERKL